MTEDEDISKGMEEVPRIANCKHRWVEGDNKQNPAYKCIRCGAWRFVE